MAYHQVIKYRGLTKKQYKRQYGSSTPGSQKGPNCKATALQKALLKYPRAYKTMPDKYLAMMRSVLKRGKSSNSSIFNQK